MAASKQIFERTEKKYTLDSVRLQGFTERIGCYMKPDDYKKSTVMSLYFDTPDYRLIRASLEKPVYKEKLRLRSYGVPSQDSKVFLELKKKYKSVVYKRREEMTLGEAKAYFAHGALPKDTQIMHELDWMVRSYGQVKPAALICYEREALVCALDRNLRITFDSGIRCRSNELLLEKGTAGKLVTSPDTYVMEIKALGAMPLWLTQALDEFGIFPDSFSKYGTAYKMFLRGENKCSTYCFSQYSQIPSQRERILSVR